MDSNIFEIKAVNLGMKEYIMEVADNGMVTKVGQEIVRCKDCKHFTEPDENGFGVCMKIMHGCQSWGFCADGERRPAP